MTPARIDLTIYQGTSYRLPLGWKTRVDGVEVPVDLTGCTARMQIRRRLRSTEVELDLGVAGYITIESPLEGRMAVDIPAEVTAAMAFRSGVYDIEIEFAGGEVYRFAQGAVRLVPEVTRSV
jgi:hypothetical protein